MNALPQHVPPAGSPFDLADDRSWRAWRDAKLAAYPRGVEDLWVEVRDPMALTPGERRAILERCAHANMALYRCTGAARTDSTLPRELGRQLGLTRLHANWLADEDGISPIAVSDMRGAFIPYTNRAIKWHTDGYYHPGELAIRAMTLHCVRPAAAGGGNALLDHELA
jgi:hypothetical protein